jgi:predicted  nucleic acid-binding Zn-ribbon protein
MLDQLDAFGPKIAAAEKVLKTTQENLAAARADLQQQAALIQGDIERIEGELRLCESELPDVIREDYQRRARSNGEDALAEVVDGACGGCFQQVPVNVQSNIRMSLPSFCRTCGRLLYFAEEK